MWFGYTFSVWYAVLMLIAVSCVAVKFGEEMNQEYEERFIRPNISSEYCMKKFSCDGDHTNACHCDSLCEITGDCCKGFKPNEIPKNIWTQSQLSCVSNDTADFGTLLVSSCPADWEDDESRTFCENVTGKVQLPDTYMNNDGIVFKNIYCAFCNRVLPQAYNLDVLKICANESLGEELKYMANCSFLYEKVAEPDSVRSCLLRPTGCDSDATDGLLKNCTDGEYGLVYDLYGNVYRNIYCGLCNDVPEGELSCEKHKKNISEPYPFKNLIKKGPQDTGADNATKMDDSNQDDGQIYVTVVALVISIFSLIITLTVYVCFPKLMNITGKIIFCLALSLLLAQFLFLVSSETERILWLCSTMAVLVHYFFLSAFCWMNVIAYEIWMKFANHIFDHGDKKKFYFYSLYAWLVPVIIVTISLIFNFTKGVGSFNPRYGKNGCGIYSENATWLFFVGPLALFKLFDIVAFVCTIYHIRKTRKETSLAREGNTCTFLINLKLSLIMGLTWTFSFLAKFSDNEVLWYMFTIFNAIQGLYIFLCFVCNKKVFGLIRKTKGSSVTKISNVKSSHSTQSTHV